MHTLLRAHRYVQDLYWAVNSASPYSLPQITQWQDQSAWFKDFMTLLIRDPQPLVVFVGDMPRFIGSYFEKLWQFYMHHHPRYFVLAHNVQINLQGTTQGEIDMVVFDKHSQQQLHIELACKFYLSIDPSNDMSLTHAWVGVANNDCLQHKYHTMCNKQQTLYSQPSVQAYLQQHGLQMQSTMAIMKGLHL